jgi:hypothetical protein
LFARLANRETSSWNLVVNGHNYDMGYYLAEGISLPRSIFVKKIHSPDGRKNSNFGKDQETAWKDIKR